jgi:flagellar motor switch protein FliG
LGSPRPVRIWPATSKPSFVTSRTWPVSTRPRWPKLVDDRDLVLALKGANKELAERVYRVYGPDKAASIRADVSAVTQVSWEDIRAAQQQIRNILRGLVSLGKIRFK